LTYNLVLETSNVVNPKSTGRVQDSVGRRVRCRSRVRTHKGTDYRSA